MRCSQGGMGGVDSEQTRRWRHSHTVPSALAVSLCLADWCASVTFVCFLTTAGRRNLGFFILFSERKAVLTLCQQGHILSGAKNNTLLLGEKRGRHTTQWKCGALRSRWWSGITTFCLLLGGHFLCCLLLLLRCSDAFFYLCAGTVQKKEATLGGTLFIHLQNLRTQEKF